MNKIIYTEEAVQELSDRLLSGIEHQHEQLKNYFDSLDYRSGRRLATMEQVCEKYDTYPSTINNWVKEGKFKKLAIGGRIYFDLDEIENALIEIR